MDVYVRARNLILRKRILHALTWLVQACNDIIQIRPTVALGLFKKMREKEEVEVCNYSGGIKFGTTKSTIKEGWTASNFANCG